MKKWMRLGPSGFQSGRAKEYLPRGIAETGLWLLSPELAGKRPLTPAAEEARMKLNLILPVAGVAALLLIILAVRK